MNMNILRPAIAMIELIFAIVIMGIVMMSAPMLVSTATQSSYVAIQQEGINEAASRVHMIMGYAWDENNVNDDYRPPILTVTNGDPALDKNNTTQRRIGIPMASHRTFIQSDTNTTSNLNASALGKDGITEPADDIDDFTDPISLEFVERDDNTVGYVEKTTININTTIVYNTDNADYNQSTISYVPFITGVATTNIKSIEVNLTSISGVDELEKTIILRAFSSNIGGYTFEERRF